MSGGSAASWSTSGDELTVSQANNSSAAVYLTTLPIEDVTVTFDMEVTSNTDDDYFGFVVAYDEGEEPDAHWILFDWLQSTQSNGTCTGTVGLAMSQVTGDVDVHDLWCHTGAVSEVARSSTYSSTGWTDNTAYTVELTYTSTSIEVSIDGVVEFSETGLFPTGWLGFYTNSQDSVVHTLTDPIGDRYCLTGSRTATRPCCGVWTPMTSTATATASRTGTRSPPTGPTPRTATRTPTACWMATR
ncbi:MAG: hypothetical protein GY884_20220 [Proteobacteria bacterium]|nr:hypothetical protein [Pseudomonadota bacterium]